MSNSLGNSGYDLEDKYFHNSEKEKLKTVREAREATKKALAKEIHWMRCPKCGGQMEETSLEGIMIDKCRDCKGIYFDQGELEVLMGHRESDSFLGKLIGFLKH
ncbi:MAG: zf-TFIIB domain-containing protein [Lentisphaerales bacterium]|nr:zf-TFIIB domain-containing protein [Lentisphaerales bacterium]